MKQNRDQNIAFVAMCFDTRLHHIYQKVVKPVVESYGFTCLRADEISKVGIVMNQVQNSIDNANLFICDLTYENPNVFYELGVAHVLNKPSIMISQAPANIPFDVHHFRVIPYVDDKLGLLDLRDDLVKVIVNNFHLDQKIFKPRSSFSASASIDEIDVQRSALLSSSVDYKRYAIKFLGDCKHRDSFSKIEMIALSDSNPDIVREAFTSLYKIDSEKALPKLLEQGLLYQKELLVRERVVSLIGNYKPNKQLIDHMISQLDDSSWGVRRCVCEVLGRWGEKDAIGPLKNRLEDCEPQVKISAIEALELIEKRSREK